jgi:hypothetical protein
LKHHIVRVEMALRAPELLIVDAERRTAIAGDKACGVQAGRGIAHVLADGEPDQGLRAGQVNPPRGRRVFVVERDATIGGGVASAVTG